jgi:hypothetical protein
VVVESNVASEEDKVILIEEPEGIIELNVFSQTTNYDNNLSTIASKVEFIPLAMEPLINDFQVLDIIINDDYCFLQEMYQVFQYDKQGNFIRFIGSRGGGPGEYIQLQPPLQIENTNKLLYVSDLRGRKMMIFNFDGKLERSFNINADDVYITIIDTNTIAAFSGVSQRRAPNTNSIKFIDHNGKSIKVYKSYIHPILGGDQKSYGPDTNMSWESNGNKYFLEYASDTIFQIVNDELIPKRVLTGDLMLEKNEYTNLNRGRKLLLVPRFQRPHSAIFESYQYIIFKLFSDYESFYMVYDKLTKNFFRTFYENPAISYNSKIMTYFTDDMISGMLFNPVYQSDGKAIALLQAEEIVNNREEILAYIVSHPSAEGEKLKGIVENLDEMDNPIMMIVTLK